MAANLVKAGHTVHGFDVVEEARERAKDNGDGGDIDEERGGVLGREDGLEDLLDQAAYVRQLWGRAPGGAQLRWPIRSFPHGRDLGQR